MKATYTRRNILFDKEEVVLEPGQFLTGRKSLSQEYNESLSPKKKVKETTLWSWIKKFEKWGKIDIKSTNKYSIITVLNWSEYQSSLTTEHPQDTNELTRASQPNDTNKNEKEIKKGKEGRDNMLLFYK
ncbi:hypothetical protein V8V54_26475 [Priestia megaterium]|uniref:hypothetical protein n=1 Tax=Priestia megaterium TaxID=1404 RepID=UPI0030089790